MIEGGSENPKPPTPFAAFGIAILPRGDLRPLERNYCHHTATDSRAKIAVRTLSHCDAVR